MLPGHLPWQGYTRRWMLLNRQIFYQLIVSNYQYLIAAAAAAVVTATAPAPAPAPAPATTTTTTTTASNKKHLLAPCTDAYPTICHQSTADTKSNGTETKPLSLHLVLGDLQINRHAVICGGIYFPLPSHAQMNRLWCQFLIIACNNTLLLYSLLVLSPLTSLCSTSCIRMLL